MVTEKRQPPKRGSQTRGLLILTAIWTILSVLLIFVVIPFGFNKAFLTAKPGWNVRRYQRDAVPRAGAGVVLLGVLTAFSAVRERRAARSSEFAVQRRPNA